MAGLLFNSDGSRTGQAPAAKGYIGAANLQQAGAQYATQYAANDRINNLNAIAKNSSKLNYSQQYQLINDSAKAGVLSKSDQLKLIQTIGLRQDAQASKQDLKGSGNWLVDNVVTPFVRAVGAPGKTIGAVTGGNEAIFNKDLASLQAQYKAGGLTKDELQQIVQKRYGDVIANNVTVGDNGLRGRTKLESVANFAGQFADAGTQVAGIIPGGGLTTKALNIGGKVGMDALKAGAGQVIKDSAKQALVTGTAQTGADALNGRKIDATTLAANYLAPTALGAAGEGVTRGLSTAFKAGANARLARMTAATEALENKTGGATKDLMPKLTNADINELKSPYKVNVNGESTTDRIGVSSPTKIGVKDISSTSKVEVKTPTPMSDKQYTSEFNKIGKSYDRASAQAELLPKARQQSYLDNVEKSHQARLDDLDTRYQSSKTAIADRPSKVTTVDRTTTPAPKNTGGVPKGYINTDGTTAVADAEARAAAKTARAEQRAANATEGQVVTPKETKPVQLKQTNGETDIADLSKKAGNSFENASEGAKPGGIERAKAEIEAGTAKPIRIRTTDEGKLIIEDGRHRLQAAKELGLESYPTEDVSAEYRPQAKAGSEQGSEKVLAESGARKTPAGANAGKTTTAGSATRAEARAVESKLATSFEEKASYKGVSFKEEAQKAADLVKNDPERARAIAMNEKPGDNIAHEVAVRHALENKAMKEGDIDTLRALARSESHTATSEAAQRLGAEGYAYNPNSAVANIQAVMRARSEALKNRGRTVDAALKAESKKITEKIKPLTKDDWNSFINSIAC